MDDEEDPFDTYVVVRNERNDHSIWPAIKPIPPGWSPLGVEAPKEECLDWIEQHWEGPSLGGAPAG